MNIEITRTTYVAYLHPGIFVETVKPVNKRDPQVQAMSAPSGVFAFYYFDAVKIVLSSEDERVETNSDQLDVSGRYYLDAELMGRDDVKNVYGSDSLMLCNMRANGWRHVVRCNTGDIQAFCPDRDELVATC